jgi:flagellin
MTRISPGLHGVDQQLLQNYQRNNDRAQTSLERLSTGKRINHPSDDPPGFIAAEGLRKELSDLKQKLGDISTERAESHVQQSGLSDIQDALNDLRGQVVSAADGTLTVDQRTTLENAIDETAKAVDRIANLTGTQGVPSLDTSTGTLSSNPDAAQVVDNASQSVTTQRVTLAAQEHANLDTFQQLDQDQIAITTEALSNIEDTDYAAEAANLSQSQVLSQGAMAALAYNSHQNATQLTQLLDSIA